MIVRVLSTWAFFTSLTSGLYWLHTQGWGGIWLAAAILGAGLTVLFEVLGTLIEAQAAIGRALLGDEEEK